MATPYPYQLIRSRRQSLGLEIKPDGTLLVRAPYKMRIKDIEAFIAKKSGWINRQTEKLRQAKARQNSAVILTEEEIRRLTEEAKAYIPQRVAHYAEALGVTYGRVTIRHQRTKWGSCSSKGNLNFNCLLMLMSPEVIDSVVVHELCHRKEMNHSKRFYDEVLRVFPSYPQHNRWLKENGSAVMARLPQNS